MKWQPINTAPKDGTEILLTVKERANNPCHHLVGHYMPGGYCIEDHPAIDEGWYFWNGCMFDKASDPTHWMSLPDLPATDKQKDPADTRCPYEVECSEAEIECGADCRFRKKPKNGG